MTWYEKHRGGHRARWKTADGRQPAGPTKPTEDEAKAWAIANGLDAPIGDGLEDLIKRWRQVRSSERNVTDGYLDQVVEKLLPLCAKRRWVRIQDVTLLAIDDWKVAVKGHGVERPLAYLLSVLRWGDQNAGVTVDAKVLRYRKPRRRPDNRDRPKLTERHVQLIIEHFAGLGPNAHALIYYLATYGARPITACRLLIGELDLIGRTMRAHGKRSGKWRHPITPYMVKLFKAATTGRRRRDPVFLDPRTNEPWKLSTTGAERLCSWYARNVRGVVPEALGRIYDLKRYAITRMLEAGLDAKNVALFTGHRCETQVLVYARTDADSALKALSKFATK